MTPRNSLSLPMAAPPLHVTQWFNTERAITIESLRGHVVVLHAFQMLCPGCVSHGIPQAHRIRDTFAASDVSVIGLHTVFEHHDAMTTTALAAFLHEYRIRFPVGVDEPSVHGHTPRTMEAYGMRGTPSLILIGRSGAIEEHFFGQPSDLHVGAAIARLTAEPPAEVIHHSPGCDEDACEIQPRTGAA